MLEKNKIYHQDCIIGMQQIDDNSVDLILCDLPYGTTQCRWDCIIPFDQLWEQYERIIKPNGAIVLTSAQPFTTKLISSNVKQFKYCWYWLKNCPTGYPFAKYQPMRCIEDVCVFYKSQCTYNPQGLIVWEKPKVRHRKDSDNDKIYKESSLTGEYVSQYSNYPRHILEFKCERGYHPTQKPVTLFEYLIKTYTDKGELVLDNCIGSGTTAIACINTGRDYIGFELDQENYIIATERVAQHNQR